MSQLNRSTPTLRSGTRAFWYLISSSRPKSSTRVHIGISAYLRQFKPCIRILGHTITIGRLSLPSNSPWSNPFHSLMPLTLSLALGRPIRATSWIMLLETRI